MTVTKDFLIATLAMDAYNRGYNSGLLDEGQGDQNGLGEAGSEIGDAIVLNIGLPEDSREAGFYAIAYDTPHGTVISYRELR